MMFRITRVSPSIIATNWQDKEHVKKVLKELEKAGAGLIHLDVMDGKFVKNKTFGPDYVDFIRNNTNLLLDVHLMVANPDEEVEKYIKVGADIITVHYENTKNLPEVLKKIKSKNVLAGVAISPKTSTMKLTDILKTGLVDVVVVMGVEPGASGQSFIPGSAEKVAEVSEMSRNVFISIDGGVNLKNAKLLRRLGANILVSGACIFNSKHIIHKTTSIVCLFPCKPCSSPPKC